MSLLFYATSLCYISFSYMLQSNETKRLSRLTVFAMTNLNYFFFFFRKFDQETICFSFFGMTAVFRGNCDSILY